MALAPRLKLTGDAPGLSQKPDAIAKRGQRARNKAAGKTSRAGSSGEALLLKDMPKYKWEDIEDEVEHIADVAARISHSQIGASGFLVSTLNSPLEYAHDLLDVHLRARDGLCYIRIYHVSLESYLAAGKAKDAGVSAQDQADMDLVDSWLGSGDD